MARCVSNFGLCLWELCEHNVHASQNFLFKSTCDLVVDLKRKFCEAKHVN